MTGEGLGTTPLRAWMLQPTGPEEVKASLTWSQTLVTLFEFLILLRPSTDVES